MKTKKNNPIQNFFNSCPDYVGIADGCIPMYKGHIPEKNCYFGCNCLGKPVIVIEWSQTGRGFGQYTFFMKNGKLYCDNECDSKSQIALVLLQLLNKSILLDKPTERKSCVSSKANSNSKRKSTTKTSRSSRKGS